MQLFDMTGKVAVITGSTRGIGKAIAYRMAEHGAKVTVSSRKAAACDETAAEINASFPGSAIAVPANISSKEDLQRLVDETRKAFGKVDVLVCNAASNPYYGPMSGITDEQFRKILENNIIANNWLVTMVTPEMRERRDGSIPTTSASTASRRAWSRPTSPRRSGIPPRASSAPASTRRCAAWASPTTSPARPSTWARAPAPGPAARP